MPRETSPPPAGSRALVMAADAGVTASDRGTLASGGDGSISSRHRQRWLTYLPAAFRGGELSAVALASSSSTTTSRAAWALVD